MNIITTVTKQPLHPIVMVDYIPRLTGHLLTFTMIGSTLFTRGHESWIPYTLLFIEGFIWPNVALFFSMRSKNPKKLELNFLLFDSLIIGFWIGYIDFALFPSTVLFVCIIMSNFSIQGFALAIKGVIATLIGLTIILIFHGIHFQPQTTLIPTLICIVVLISYNSTMGYLTYIRAAGLKQTRNKLRAAYHEVDNLNKILEAASSTLDLNKIMKQISSAISVFFRFNFVTVQIVDETKHELFFKALYNSGAPVTKGDISILHPKLNYGNCLSVKAYIENKPVYIPEITSDMELSYIDKNLLEIIGFKAVLYIPLSVQDNIIGVIGFYNNSKMILTEHTLNSVKLQLSHIALNIGNAILYEELKQKAQ